MKAIIIPGNSVTPIKSNWYLYVKKELEKLGIEVIAEDMPDPDMARKEIWLPFIEQRLKGDENAILIGHSSGAVAIQRYLENHKAQGAVLVGTCYTDLGGDEKERVSGYYDEEWRWDKIKQNAKWIILFASVDDPYISVEEARYIRDKINPEYFEYTDQGHFGSPYEDKTEFPELVEAIKSKIFGK